LLGFPLFLSGGNFQTTLAIAPQRVCYEQFKEPFKVAYDSKGKGGDYSDSSTYASKDMVSGVGGEGDCDGVRDNDDSYGGSDGYGIKSLSSYYA
jgi:hypothetical protein